jgi:hypothetical protein
MTLALVHAQHLRDYVRYHLEQPRDLAEVWDTVTEAEMTPWYRSTVREDRTRAAEIRAIRDGLAPPAPREGEDAVLAAFPVAAARDADVFRALVDTRSGFATPEDVLARPGMPERIIELAAEPMAPPPGPTRAQLLELIAA